MFKVHALHVRRSPTPSACSPTSDRAVARSLLHPPQVGTPICVPSRGGVDLGRIASLEKDHKAVTEARKGDAVAMKIEVGVGGRQGAAGWCWVLPLE